MIFGIGTDIVEIQRIESALTRFGERFAQRLLGEAELAQFREFAQPSRFLAKRFAAKEAVAKALGTGFRHGIALDQITVANDDSGKPIVKLAGAAKNFASENRVSTIHLSLSDERHYAVAFATAVTDENAITP